MLIYWHHSSMMQANPFIALFMFKQFIIIRHFAIHSAHTLCSQLSCSTTCSEQVETSVSRSLQTVYHSSASAHP